ncbi:MAG: hypothetical protein DI604_26865 [Delftia acidovorans]|nr:MAG: hypothetical protein DI604_26865 [Delftia acidovorans]
MSDIDARTGEPIQGFVEVEQSIEKILTTAQGERVMREWFGNPGLRLLGENMTPETVLLWYTIVWALIELFEPRFKIKRFETNSATRLGELDATMVGEYRPYAHLNWQQAKLFVSVVDGAVSIRSVS